MPLNWIDTTELSFNHLLLLERVQIGWLPAWSMPPAELSLALHANPVVVWYLSHKCPEVTGWVRNVMSEHPFSAPLDPQQVRHAEQVILDQMQDLLVYATDPSIYDAQPFLNWDPGELTSLVDFTGKVVIDAGSGTGRQVFIVAPLASTIYAVEPVENLRRYLREKAARLGYSNVFPVDGLVTAIPFPDGFADVVMSGHVYGDRPAAELAELERVLRPGGMLIFIPGSNDRNSPEHEFLVSQGYAWERFEEPEDGWKRKYWRVKPL